MKKLIAFTGLAHSGKTTASAYLENNYGYAKVNFKGAIIDEIKALMPDFLEKEAEIYDCSVDQLFTTKPGSFRQFMQNYGTDLRRKEDPDYWVNKWLAAANKIFLSNDTGIVVDDLRFINEAEIVRRVGGIIIRIIKEGQVQSMSHESESEMSKITPDYTISVAPGDIDGLCNQLEKIYGSDELQRSAEEDRD